MKQCLLNSCVIFINIIVQGPESLFFEFKFFKRYFNLCHVCGQFCYFIAVDEEPEKKKVKSEGQAQATAVTAAIPGAMPMVHMMAVPGMPVPPGFPQVPFQPIPGEIFSQQGGIIDCEKSSTRENTISNWHLRKHAQCEQYYNSCLWTCSVYSMHWQTNMLHCSFFFLKLEIVLLCRCTTHATYGISESVSCSHANAGPRVCRLLWSTGVSVIVTMSLCLFEAGVLSIHLNLRLSVQLQW